jgi:hypothetical protein
MREQFLNGELFYTLKGGSRLPYLSHYGARRENAHTVTRQLTIPFDTVVCQTPSDVVTTVRP